MLDKLGVFGKKYIFPIILILFGLILVLKGAKPDAETGISQTKGFLYGGIAILSMGFITLLYMVGIINRIVHIALSVVLLVITVVLFMQTVKSVEDTIAQIELKEETDDMVKQALTDISDIQVAYRNKYGIFAKNFKTLKNFLENDSVMDILTSGQVPDSQISDPEEKKKLVETLGYKMTDDKKFESYEEEEAIILGYLKKDTIYHPVMEILFTGEEAMKHANDRAFMFEADNLSFVPMQENVEFYLKADTLDDGTWVFLAKDPSPYDPFSTKDTLKVGSLKEPKTSGNWIGED